jgi:hypothetical protein
METMTEPTSEQAAQEAEELADEERHADLDEAAEQLSFPVGGIKATKAMVQVTGGELEVPPHLLPDKDEEVEVIVRGWVKTHKHTTEKKGGVAARVAVIVVEEVEIPKITG